MTAVKRFTALDILRGMAVISMIIYHAMWDIVNMFGVDIAWFDSSAAVVWQQSIRWGFVLISGFCWSLGSRKMRRAITVLAASAVVSAVTAIFTPQNFILFGVLSLIGTGMLVTVPLDRIYKKINPYMGICIFAILFVLTYNIELGTIEFFGSRLLELPEWLYANYFTAYLGFPHEGFTSPDYVPIFPWLFMFWIGYFLYHIFEKHGFLQYLSFIKIKPLEYIGRNSLIIYMVHQPIVYALLYLWFAVF